LPIRNNTYKVLNRAVGRALHRYEMISDGDRIIVGLSGGKDSLTVLSLLEERRVRVPVKYELFPVFIDPGFEGGFAEELQAYCNDAGFTLKIEFTNFGIISHSSLNRENPCFLCSRLRRKRLFNIAEELGCTKIALGHNQDDIIETLFLNMCCAGQISTMSPCQSFFDNRLYIIRPLAFAGEDIIRRFAAENGFPDFTNPCPSAKGSKRHEIKVLLKQLYMTNKNARGNIFRSLSNVKTEYLLK